MLQLCLTPSHSTDCRPLGSSVHGALQARTLEWVDLLDPGLEPASLLSTCQAASSPLAPPNSQEKEKNKHAEDVETQEPPCTTGVSAKWGSQGGEQDGTSSKNNPRTAI